jgi:peptide/nickel transport system substrate-binding protein
MKSKYTIILVSVLVMVSMLLASCKPAATPTAAPVATTEAPAAATTAAPAVDYIAPSADNIVIGTTDKVASLDAADAYATRDWEVLKNISDGLLNWKPGTTELEPDLATDMGTVSEDGLTYTFTLRDGIKFADGTPLTATMYAAQLNRLLTIGPSCPNDVADALAVPYVASITAPDDKTMVFTLTGAYAYFRNILATAPYVVTDPRMFKADACNLFPEGPIYGTGAWYISQYSADEQMVFEPNPYYIGKYPAQVKSIIVRNYSDPNTMSLAVQSGEIDVAWRMMSADQITSLKDVKNITVGTINGGGIRFLTVNLNKAPTNDPNVVKAIASAIDRNEIVDTVYGGAAVPLYSMVPPGFIGATEAFDSMYASPNLDAAKGFLTASGYSETKPLLLDLWYPPEHYGAATASWMQLIKKQLEATGMITVNLQAQEWSTYIPALTGGESYSVGVMGWFFDYPDTSNYLDPFVYNGGMGNNITTAAEGSTTGTPINDKASQLVALLQQADVELDDTKRIEEYKQAQDLYADLGGNIPLFFEAEHVVYSPSVHGNADQAAADTLNIGPNVLFYYSMLTKSAQ